ncbi:MAG: DUF3078 domain-containing protein [Duncaniella sp.]|nr:DUF3078 domain-containing protein [Duncaniella sp.]
MKRSVILLSAIALLHTSMSAADVLRVPESVLIPIYQRNIIYNYITPDSTDTPEVNSLFFESETAVPERKNNTYIFPDTVIFEYYGNNNAAPLPEPYLLSPVFSDFQVFEPLTLATPTLNTPTLQNDETRWLTNSMAQADMLDRVRQSMFINHPELVIYDVRYMSTPPRQYTATVDPATARILIQEVVAQDIPLAELTAQFKKRHWLKAFDANLQFSQAYVSPNWYQGGNNNLNGLLNLYYNVKLNPAFHKTILFENTIQYKLGINNAPDDEIRDYSISQDLFQWNMTFGYRSSRRWYYSINSQFKTQLLNNYKSNSTTLKAAFLSPGELNVGVGMTYNYANAKKTFTFDASISPFSYNLKTCTRRRMNVTSYGIEPGRKTVSEYGSSAEGKLTWQICDNISLRSRLFAFTDYDYIQSDWENTIQFTINRFLTTQIFVHMRYDTTSPSVEDSEWHKLMMKEILSFGFTYKFQS